MCPLSHFTFRAEPSPRKAMSLYIGVRGAGGGGGGGGGGGAVCVLTSDRVFVCSTFVVVSGMLSAYC